MPLVGILKYVCAIAVALGVTHLTGAPLYGAAIGAVAYLVASGGIHLDGWLDTIDALYAYGKDRYAVMREPQVGALGVVWLSFYLMLFVPTLAFALYDMLTAPSVWPKILALSVAFIASKINSFYILQYALHHNKMHQDTPMTLEPTYYFHRFPITHWATYALIYTGVLFAIFAGLLVMVPDDAPLLITWLVLIVVLTVGLNGIITKPIIKELGFANGDVFGALICMFELVYALLYTLIFVRITP